jgi:hypothetical protein
MGNGTKTVEDRIRYSVNALAMVKDLVSESSGRVTGDLELELDGGWLNIEFTGREDIARRLEEYIGRVKYDGTHEAMMASLNSGENR